MKVTYDWLKDFVEIKISADALAHKLTMAGLEVTSLEKQAGDFVFEIEVTSNRPDWLSVIGIAREIAAITGKRLAGKPVSRLAGSNPLTRSPAHPLTINIEDKNDCPLYTARIIRDVLVCPTPTWLKKRLELIGCRSVNNIVDITNYILFEWGEPLHAFDLDKLSNSAIIVRRGKAGEKLTTIDGKGLVLAPEVLVIADREKPVAIAGIIGGKDTEVTASTKNVLLEAAIFNPIVIRRSRRNLGIQSDSSYRFERGVDLETAQRAALRAAELIQQIAKGTCILAKCAGSLKAKKKQIDLDAARVQKIAGVNISAPKIKTILSNLGFAVKTKAKNKFSIGVPGYRQDIDSEIDLIEEICRIFGYERIAKTLPRLSPQLSKDKTRERLALIKNILIGLGLNEVITHSLINQDLLKYWQGHNLKPIEILNPLSKEQEILRPTIIPSLSQCIAYNLNQQQSPVNIFEIAKAFSQTGNSFSEELVLGFALCGTKSLLLAQGLIKDPAGYLHLKGILGVLFEHLGIKDYNFRWENADTVSIYAGGDKFGIMARLTKDILDYLDIKNKEVFVAELSLSRFLPYTDLTRQFVHLPVYPGISRDISLILKEEVLVGDILEAIKEKGKPWLREAKVIDCYKGKQIPAGLKSLTVSCFYRADKGTLTEAEINPLHSAVCAALVEQFGLRLR